MTTGRSSRNPFQLWVLAACVISGVIGLLPLGARTGTIDRLLPTLAALLWYGGLLASSAVCLAGAVIRHPLCLLVERVGMVLLGGLLAGYGGAVLLTAAKVPTGYLLVALAFATVQRIRQIGRELDRIRGGLAALVHEKELR
jgi:hypothetical protein